MLQKLKALGPGLLYAGAAIGVSHIVQSTKAGAQYGAILIVGIVLAHIFKYPFFELGPRYIASTGENLLQGYRRLGKWALAIVIFLTVTTMFTIQAAVTVVTAGLAMRITGIHMEPWQMSGILLLICIIILGVGKFKLLDNLMKVIMVVLAITTIVAFVSSFYAVKEVYPESLIHFDLRDKTHILFLIAFLGWMPAPIDISIWHSLWSEENNRSKGIKSTLKQSLFDFKIGYWGTAFLAICFLMLGANVIYGTGAVLSDKGTVYAGQFIDMYESSLGRGAYFIIAIAAFTTMFSTTLTCLDAMPRVLVESLRVWSPVKNNPTIKGSRIQAIAVMFIIAIGAMILLAFYISNMKQMVTVVTSISFITTPILAVLGIMLVRKHLPIGFWSKGKTIIAWLGVIFLTLLVVYYLVLTVNF